MKSNEKKAQSKRTCVDDIKLTVQIPDKRSESVRREQISLIYGILTPKSA